jgi:hypothetical protein
MSEEFTEEEFKSAAAQVDDAHKQAVAELRAKVAKVKSDALSKLKV